MKTIISKIRQQDMIKKIVIGFITISFIIIVGIGSYRSINGENSKHQNNGISQNIENENNNPLEDVKEETTKSQEQKKVENNKTKEQTKKDNKSQTKSQETTKNTNTSQDTLNNSTSEDKVITNNPSQSLDEDKETTLDVEKNININVTIKGLNSQIIASDNMIIKEKSTVYTALDNLSKDKGLNIEKSKSILGIYIVEINGLREKEHGAASGWTYYVNGVFANKSCDAYILKNNDSVEWVYQYE